MHKDLGGIVLGAECCVFIGYCGKLNSLFCKTSFVFEDSLLCWVGHTGGPVRPDAFRPPKSWRENVCVLLCNTVCP